LPVRSGRAAIIISLRALGLGPGSRIGVPLYCCPVVFKAIKTAGCLPRFLDVDPGTFCVSSADLYAKRSELDALIAVHMFGHLCDMGDVRKAMEEKPVIEDCAQALGSTWHGQGAGSMGTMGVFSFRLGKYLSVGEGAEIYAGPPGLRETLARLLADLPEPTFAEELKHVFETFARAKLRSRPLWGLLGSSVWSRYNAKTDFVDKSPIVLTQVFRSDWEIARHRMTRLPQMIEAQRQNAEYYVRNLELDPSMLSLERPGTFYNRLMFPIVFGSPKQRDSVRSRLRQSGISSATPYEEAIEGAAKNYGYDGDCPVAEGLLRRTLVIPCNSRLRRQDVEHIARSLNAAWAESGPR
jgi:dTDP-4-amino-4,6-dideoxygalactose transaminase